MLYDEYEFYSFIETYRGFDILKGMNVGYYTIKGYFGAYSSPEVCKRVIDVYIDRTNGNNLTEII